MTDLRIDRDLGAKILGAISIVALIAGIVFLCLPKPSEAAFLQSKKKQISDMEAKAKAATAEQASFEQSNKARLWTGSFAEIGPEVLAEVTRLAKSHRLKLATFRPQKPTDMKGLTELPFLMAVEGPFPELAQLLSELEKPENKLAVLMIQLAAGDQTSDTVTASISIAAFVEQQPAPTTDSKSGTKAKGGQNGKTL
jgi:Tfp pilus assembly protein PilO